MRSVFLDTVGLLATWDTSDQWHDAATSAYSGLVKSKAVLVTTPYVLLECGNAASRRPYRSAVVRLVNQLETANLLIAPTTEVWRQAWTAYDKRLFGEAGIVDNISFVVMHRLGISEAFTNDKHFRAAGFEPLF